MAGVIRAATMADAPVLAAVEAAVFPDAWLQASVEAELAQAVTRAWLLEVDGVVAATLLGWVLADELQVNRVAVLPSHRRGGFGRQVMQHAMAAALSEGATRVLLEVRAGNDAAVGLYASLGFERAGRRRGYYPDGEDALVMTCSLGTD